MTTREATSLLARSTGADVMDDYARSLSERAAVIAFGAIQWPWLLRSLHGGKLADKHALLDRLDLPYDALPYLGSWKADTGLLTLLVDHILEHKPAPGRRVRNRRVDPGDGPRDEDGRRRNPDQLRPAWRFRRRDPPVAHRSRSRSRSARGAARAVARRLAGPVVRSRAAALGHRSHADRRAALDDPSADPGRRRLLVRPDLPGGTVMLDDAARPGERLVARRWRKLRPDFSFSLDKSGTKGTLIGRRQG